MDRFLIINADDFGLSAGVNRAIMEAHRFGTVTSATLMVNLPGFAEAVQLALATPTLGVGLHFNLTYGRPVAPGDQVTSLIDERGNFTGNHKIWHQQDVLTELEVQWERIRSTGIPITHLDAHHNIHHYQVVCNPMVALALQEKIPMRKKTGNVSSQYPLTTHKFIGETYFIKHGTTKLIKQLKSLKQGVTELNCHPGYVDKDLQEISPWTSVREAELKVFTSSKVLRTIRKLKVNMVNFSHLQG